MVIELAAGVEVVGELPVAYLRNLKVAILADTHIGFEEEMADKGVFIPRFQKRRVIGLFDELINTVDVDTLVIAGDFKHRFSGLGRVERIELSEILRYVLGRVSNLVVVRGNHDNYLTLLTRRFRFKIVDYLLLGNVLVVHGHNELPKGVNADIIVMGHEHPTVALRDALGSIGRFQCFLVGELVSGAMLVTLPAIGAYQTGSKVTLDRNTYLSPILRNYAVLETLRPVVIDEEVGVLELPTLNELYEFI